MSTPQRTAITTDKAPQAIGPYSQAIRSGNWLFASGQAALDPTTGQLVGTDVAMETTRAMENLRAVLQAAGTDFDRVVKSTVFLIDMGDFAAMNEIYASYFPAVPPARSTVAVAQLPRGARVEIECIALIEA